jgi:hypothetical protein
MQYETFLFTRNLMRDFTAFVRPAAMTNKEVSTIASAFNYVNDITPFTQEQPALYCFPLGAYLYVLRHYNSGRKHAGREIAVIEGIAVRREDEPDFRARLADAAQNHARILNIVGSVGDTETLQMAQSETLNWPEADDMPDSMPADERPELIDTYTRRYPTHQLMLPFNAEGFGWLVQALRDDVLPILHFAFGSNSEVVGRLNEANVQFDVLGYLATERATLRERETRKVVDVREILPDVARVPSNWPSNNLPAETPDLATDPDFLVEVAPADSANALHTERVRRKGVPPRRSLLQAVVDFILGRE